MPVPDPIQRMPHTSPGLKHRRIGPKPAPGLASDGARVSRLMEQLGVTPPPTLPPQLTPQEELGEILHIDHMGRYSLRGLLGQGGMGVVT